MSVPIQFRLNLAVQGKTFEAFVRVDGRALMVFEDGEWNCDGVEPGGLTRSGEVPFAAFEAFRAAFRHVLDDLAEESTTLADFQREVGMLFHTNARAAERWERAQRELTRGGELDEPFQTMPRSAPRPSRITVTPLSQPPSSSMPSPAEADSVALPIAA